MTKAWSVGLLLALAGCSAVAPRPDPVSPCAAGEATYACQVERYNAVNVD